MTTVLSSATASHLASLDEALAKFPPAADLAAHWGRQLARALMAGSRLLVAGNGGSAAQAQHLSGEIVGKYRDDRPPFSAVALHSEPTAFTAILNDYGSDEVFARQVQAHGRSGDVCVLMSTSGGSRNVIAAAERARAGGLLTWAITGRAPNPLQQVCDEALVVDSSCTATVQELHLVALHVLCESMDGELQELAYASPVTRSEAGG